MSTKENGGAAFGEFKQAGECAIKSGGITVRDYFAAKALSGQLAALDAAGLNYLNSEQAASQAYSIADAMLQERAK